MEIRLQLECLALRRFAARLPPSELADLVTLNRALGEEADPQRWLRMDWEPHARLAGTDTACAEIIGDVRRRIHRYVKAASQLADRHAQATREHGVILDTLLAGDLPAAETAGGSMPQNIGRVSGVPITRSPSCVDLSARARHTWGNMKHPFTTEIIIID